MRCVRERGGEREREERREEGSKACEKGKEYK